MTAGNKRYVRESGSLSAERGGKISSSLRDCDPLGGMLVRRASRIMAGTPRERDKGILVLRMRGRC